MQGRFWVYWAFTLPSTALVFVAWYLISNRHRIFAKEVSSTGRLDGTGGSERGSRKTVAYSSGEETPRRPWRGVQERVRVLRDAPQSEV